MAMQNNKLNKMTKKIEINIPNRTFYSIITLIFISLLAIGVYAYNTNNPSTMGHTMGEIQSSCTGLLRWTGSTWSCIPIPSTCTGANQFLHWSGSSWSCATVCTNTCDWTGMSPTLPSTWCQYAQDSQYYTQCASDPASYTLTVTYCGGGCVTSTQDVVRCPKSHMTSGDICPGITPY